MSTVELLSKLREAAKTARLGQPQTNEGQMQTNEGQMQTSPGQPQTNEGQTESAHDSNSFIHRLEVALLEEGVNILPLDAEVNGQFLVVDYLITCEDGELEVKSAGRSMTAALVSLLKTLGGGVAEGYPRRTGGSQAERGFPGEQGHQAGVLEYSRRILQCSRTRHRRHQGCIRSRRRQRRPRNAEGVATGPLQPRSSPVVGTRECLEGKQAPPRKQGSSYSRGTAADACDAAAN